jgi:hypothetical protein
MRTCSRGNPDFDFSIGGVIEGQPNVADKASEVLRSIGASKKPCLGNAILPQPEACNDDGFATVVCERPCLGHFALHFQALPNDHGAFPGDTSKVIQG